jgi:hypothetical protein
VHAAIEFVVCWVLAFITLSAAVLLLNIYYQIIGNDLTLRTLRQEAAIAGFASLVEGTSAWVIVSFLPAAVRAMIVPTIIVAIVYKFTHLEDWSRYDVGLLLMFQIVIGCFAGFLFFGHFQAALITIVVFGGFLALVGSFVRSL